MPIGRVFEQSWGEAARQLLLEPALMVIIGLIVGLVVVLMYMPIFELAGAIE